MNKTNDDYIYFQKDCTRKDVLIVKKPIIGIHGMKGSFSDEAMSRFAQHLQIKESEYGIEELIHAKNVIKSVVDGKTDLGIFAVANSGSGSYQASIEAMSQYMFKVIAIFSMKINMCILSQKNIKSLKEVKEFRGHPVAIAQCRRTLQKHWSTIPMHPDTDEMDTALSAKLLSEGKIDASAAVFASMKAAQFFGLNVLVQGAHDDPLNATSFVVIKK